MKILSLEYTKGIGLRQVKVFHQDTIVFRHCDTEDFLSYNKRVQRKEKIGINVYTKKELDTLENNLGSVLPLSNYTSGIDSKSLLVDTIKSLPYTKVLVKMGKEKKVVDYFSNDIHETILSNVYHSLNQEERKVVSSIEEI